MAVYAKKECAGCGVILPRNQLYTRTIEVKSGRVGKGGSVRFGSGGRKSVGLSSSRNLYSNKQVYFCADCSNSHDQSEWAMLFVKLVGIALLGLFAWWL